MADKRCDDHGAIFAGSSFANLTRTRRAAPQIKTFTSSLAYIPKHIATNPL